MQMPEQIIWEGRLTPQECDDIIGRTQGRQFHQAEIHADTAQARAYRQTEVMGLPNDDMLAAQMFSFAMFANSQARWMFDIGFIEPLQLARYTTGGHYDWHADQLVGQSPRKLSVVVLLSDPEDYKGGDLIFDRVSEKPPTRARGSVIVFPSFKQHKVTPVTEGTRYTLASWIGGPNWK